MVTDAVSTSIARWSLALAAAAAPTIAITTIHGQRFFRRGFIADKYAVLIDALYGGLRTQHVETEVKFEDGRRGIVAADLVIEDAKTFAPATARAAA